MYNILYKTIDVNRDKNKRHLFFYFILFKFFFFYLIAKLDFFIHVDGCGLVVPKLFLLFVFVYFFCFFVLFCFILFFVCLFVCFLWGPLSEKEKCVLSGEEKF